LSAPVFSAIYLDSGRRKQRPYIRIFDGIPVEVKLIERRIEVLVLALFKEYNVKRNEESPEGRFPIG
jgi:hypothetical protein